MNDEVFQKRSGRRQQDAVSCLYSMYINVTYDLKWNQFMI